MITAMFVLAVVFLALLLLGALFLVDEDETVIMAATLAATLAVLSIVQAARSWS